MSAESPIDTSFMMLLIPNILTPFNSKESAVSEPLKLRSWRFTSKSTLLYYCLTTLLKHYLCPDGEMAPLPPPWMPSRWFCYRNNSAFGNHQVFIRHHSPSCHTIQSSLKITNQPLFSICGTLIMEQSSCTVTSASSLFLCPVTSVFCITWLWSSTPFCYYVALSRRLSFSS